LLDARGAAGHLAAARERPEVWREKCEKRNGEKCETSEKGEKRRKRERGGTDERGEKSKKRGTDDE